MTLSAARSLSWRSYGRPGFQSFKTQHPIFYSGRWPRDALVQATLDHSISSIAQADAPEGLDDLELAIEVTRGRVRELRAYCRNSRGDLLAHSGYDAAIAVPRHQVMQPSLVLVARMIWKMRSYSVDAASAIAIKNEIQLRGGSITLSELADAAHSDAKHMTNSALSLVCHGHLSLSDIKQLDGTTRLFLMPPATTDVAIS